MINSYELLYLNPSGDIITHPSFVNEYTDIINSDIDVVKFSLYDNIKLTYSNI